MLEYIYQNVIKKIKKNKLGIIHISFAMSLFCVIYITLSLAQTIANGSNQHISQGHQKRLSKMQVINVPDFWPEVANDLTTVKWSHATNSVQQLDEALNGDVMMIEADVNIGRINGTGDLIPIMAHPPTVTSDLSLEQFLNTVIQANLEVKKGAKLDFKSETILDQSFLILKSLEEKVNFPIWINADILNGPGTNPFEKPTVDPDVFFQTLNSYFKDVCVSTGWSTHDRILDGGQASYTDQHVDEMIALIARYDYPNGGRAGGYTFPLRAVMAQNSEPAMRRLLDEINPSTITIWSGAGDVVDAQRMAEAMKAVGLQNVFLDVPEELENEIRKYL